MTQPNQTGRWETGKKLYGDYTVESHLGQGGMGTVYLVQRPVGDRNLQFAVKTLIPEIAHDHKRRRVFLRELRTWIDLPDHPNIVACRFFRTIDNTLAVFAEYVDGGSLRQWVRENTTASMETRLDILIQTAWALFCAHSCGVIHQDVKPGNVLITRSGDVKLTDFGLSKSRCTGSPVKVASDDSETVMVPAGGMTMAYCSVEQANGSVVSRRTDMWSFALTALVILNGKMSWRLGAAGELILDECLEKSADENRTIMTEPVELLLRRCLQNRPDDRWPSMKVVADGLIQEYQRITGHPYFREEPEFVLPTVDKEMPPERTTSDGGIWNNPFEELKTALSHLGKETDLLERLQEKTQASQKARAVQDIEIFEQTERIYDHLIKQGRDDLRIDKGRVIFNRALAIEACQDYAHASVTYEQVLELLTDGKDRRSMELKARVGLNLSACRFLTNEFDLVFPIIELAIERYVALLRQEFHPDYAVRLSSCYMNRAAFMHMTGQRDDSLKYIEKAVDVCEELVHRTNSDESWNLLGHIVSNQATMKLELGEPAQAVDIMSHAIDILQYIQDKTDRYDSAYCYGGSLTTQAIILFKLEQYDRSVEIIDRSVAFLDQQIAKKSRDDMNYMLASALFRSGQIRFVQGMVKDAQIALARSEHLLDQVTNLEDNTNNQLQYAQVAIFNCVVKGVLAVDPGNTDNILSLWRRILSDPEIPGTRADLLESFSLIKEGWKNIKDTGYGTDFIRVLKSFLMEIPDCSDLLLDFE